MPPSILKILEQGGIVLCANARAARALSKQYGEHSEQQGRRAWETPSIFDWKQWLHGKWTQLLLAGAEGRTLLTPLQEEVLWNEIVKPGVESRSLIAAADVARLSMSAYSLLHTYDAAGHLERGEWDHPSLEPELFRRWALDMERRCKRHRWLCEAKLPWVIMDACRSGQLAPPAAVVWNGFDRLTAVDNSLRQTLEEAGCKQTDLVWQMDAEERLIVAPSMRGELEACVLWAGEQLRQNPAGTIGVLVPDVQGVRAEVDGVFRRILSPEFASGAEQETKRPYEFTLGLPLADVPAITAALILLHWCMEPQQQERITWLMTTGFFSAEDESAILAEADITMRKRLSSHELEMGETLERLSKFSSISGGNWAVAKWVRSMGRALESCKSAQGRDRYCAQWVPVLTSILKDAAWLAHGESSRKDSIHFQALERWQQALDEISALGFSDKRYDLKGFLDLFTSHVRATIFSAESLDTPITISGILESAGRSFDAVWILDATDHQWPSTTRMHPLLPIWLQMEAEMPGSSTEQDRLMAASILNRLRDSTPEVIFSYSKEGTDGAQRPSSQIAHLDEQAAGATSQAPRYVLESFKDEMTVAWPGGRSAGGQEVLKDQSACPFKAFAIKRLCAQELPSFEPGLNAAERGNIVHSALASLWADPRLADSAHLRQATLDRMLPGMVQQHVAAAFQKYERMASTEWERTYLQLEKDRVCSLIVQWLAYEERRKPFRVEKQEATETIVIDGLELRIRMDRVDEVEGGGRLLIDYKTGQVNANSWQSDRPQEPQLPIYAISGQVENLHDVLFAQVRADDIKYVSAVYKSRPDIFAGNPTDPNAAACFQEICVKWAEAISCLSLEFQKGIAIVDPKDFPKTCMYCALPGLCRVAESVGTLSDAGDDEE